jgi:3-deoxy-D-manno-octulosonate 8-phosphate phosphatase (KDO 8-P phosphatase)
MMRLQEDLYTKVKNIKLLVMDVDGTLTDGKIILGNNGEEFKSFNVKDGIGIKLAHEYGIITAIITGRKSNIVDIRAKELGIIEVHQGIDTKIEKLYELVEKLQLDLSEVAYIGDDINDIAIMEKVGLAFAVNDASEPTKKVADHITKHKGGEGAVREVIDMIICTKKVIEGEKYE